MHLRLLTFFKNTRKSLGEHYELFTQSSENSRVTSVHLKHPKKQPTKNQAEILIFSTMDKLYFVRGG